jgi:hypothetical protein
MATDSTFVPIPEELRRLIGTPDAGTRIFRAQGDRAAMRKWFNAICEHIGPSVSPGGAASYAGVSRAGVYKRMKAGGLTAFCFHITGTKKTWLGKDRKTKQWALVYIPVFECKAWGAELDERAARLNADRGSGEDEAALLEADPGEDNPSHMFLHEDPKDKGRRDVKYVDSPPPGPADEED